jgi:hypothetical protein
MFINTPIKAYTSSTVKVKLSLYSPGQALRVPGS